MSKTRKSVLVLSGVLTAGICLVMNMVLLPHIEAGTQGIRCFDMNFNYSFETAQAFINALGSDLKAYYLHVQLPLDFVYPLAYTTFFVLLMNTLMQKKSKLTALPLVLAVCDYGENIGIIRMLTAETLSPAMVSIANGFTMVKTVLLYVTILLIIALIIRRIVLKKRGNV